jgi:hypothetical protein
MARKVAVEVEADLADCDDIGLLRQLGERVERSAVHLSASCG